MVSVLLPAAGSGQRMGQGPKAFLQVGHQSLLDWALQAFAWADEVLVALPAGHVWQHPKARGLPGGATRQESVRVLLEAAQGDWVLVHDVARPFVGQEAIARVLQAAQASGAAVPVIPVPDTLVQPQEGQYGLVADREAHRLVQTPQGFARPLLLQAHRAAQNQGLQATDDAQLVLALGHPVTLVEGDRRAFKLTYPEDLWLAQGLATVWEKP